MGRWPRWKICFGAECFHESEMNPHWEKCGLFTSMTPGKTLEDSDTLGQICKRR